MKKGNVYRHYKGGLYTYVGIATPVVNIPPYTEILTATHTETLKPVQVEQWSVDAYVTPLDHPVVIYKSTKDGKLWVRPVDMFFDWVMEDGQPSIQRFKLVEGR
ncbi:hypothetical protein [Phage f2b1]|nr:hypothetical protein [Phage f2b1]